MWVFLAQEIYLIRPFIGTRVVHRNSDVLHRDISTGNIMFRDVAVPPPGDPTANTISDESNNADPDDPRAVFCGARYLLGET